MNKVGIGSVLLNHTGSENTYNLIFTKRIFKNLIKKKNKKNRETCNQNFALEKGLLFLNDPNLLYKGSKRLTGLNK